MQDFNGGGEIIVAVDVYDVMGGFLVDGTAGGHKFFNPGAKTVSASQHRTVARPLLEVGNESVD